MIVIDHGQGIETAYAHNDRNLVAPGQRVAQGDVIGRVGRSGRTTGYHLHFEYRRYGQALNPVHRMRAAL
jgi:murein DD-endopeptidase MepM/ murein hydrolase activator NlpD